MTPEDVRVLFTRADGNYLFARWGRPIVPVVFGVEDETLSIMKGAIEAVVALAGHRMAETDPELGANLLVFFLRDWAELPQVPNLDRMIDDFSSLCDRLREADANQYRLFRFDETGTIKVAFVFVRMDTDLSQVPAEVLALNQAVQVILLWSDRAFTKVSPMARIGDKVVLRPEVARIIRAAYDPVLPGVSRDVAHSYRLAARVGRLS